MPSSRTRTRPSFSTSAGQVFFAAPPEGTYRTPPLRDRREDIPILVWELIQRRQSQLGRRIDRVPEKSMQALVRYAWPGNVRELANVIERALILTPGAVLRLDAAFAEPSNVGLPPSTLRSRIKKLGIKRPAGLSTRAS